MNVINNTSESAEPGLRRYQEAGRDGHVAKAINVTMLKATLSKVLEANVEATASSGMDDA